MSIFQQHKPSLKYIASSSDQSFFSKIELGSKLSNTCHYHPEIELILIKRSKGTRIVGDSVEAFGDNDLVLIGKNTPHAFLHEPQFFCKNNTKEAQPEAMVVQFKENFLGNGTDIIPEFKSIYDLFHLAKHGLSFTEAAKENIIPLFEEFFRRTVPLDKVIILIEILKSLSTLKDYKVLSDRKYHAQDPVEDERYASILNYTYENYDEHITIEKIAQIANLTRESFCRYFKAKANKTYIEFLTEYRISKACQMIRQGRQSIKEIGYACGFDSLSNFYYQFRKINKRSPLEYSRKMYAR
ncbi:AraC family transcriptional regulator [Niabella aurantiaca]|uniref:AraC family transcriptional regulator n=1 Tax=Niabella aurantiaca TaxID=379900 RepID=UPI0003710E64|nr:AraC family transcriptional regulator [Niabella aurantiaca]